jgi:hypothetical protein
MTGSSFAVFAPKYTWDLRQGVKGMGTWVVTLVRPTAGIVGLAAAGAMTWQHQGAAFRPGTPHLIDHGAGL